MPGDAGARWVSRLVASAWCAALAFACGDGHAPVADGSAMQSPPDAAEDASVVPPEPMDAGNDPLPWDAGSGFDWEGEQCFVRVAAECDGPEDCPLESGGVGACCARFEPTAVSYTAIECARACDFRETFPLCHAGLACTADGSKECRTSFLLPDEFIGICASPLPNIVSRPPTGQAVAGEIDCGAERCAVGTEQCCLRRGFDLDALETVPHEPYCAPIGEPCDCEDRPRSPRDAGGDAARHDEDAG